MVLTAGIISLISASSNGASLSTTSANGGTAPYTQQWYRDTSGPGFTPGPGNILTGQTALTLNDRNLIPNTTYFYKVVYTDATTSTVTSSAFIVTTLPASQNVNQFSMAAFLGAMDLQVGPGNVTAVQIDATQSTPLYPGMPVKFVNNSNGIPTVVAAGTSMPNGYILYDQKSQSYSRGARCEIARTQSCIWLYSTAAIARGSMVTLDSNIASGVQQTTGSTNLPIIGEAYDQATAPGQLIRVILNVPSNMYDTSSGPITITNTLTNNNDNTMTSDVSGNTSTASIVTEVLVTKPDLNSLTVSVNGLVGTNGEILEEENLLPPNSIQIIEDLQVNLVGSSLSISANGQTSPTPAIVQPPIPSPIDGNFLSMDNNGINKDSGIALSTSSASNDDSHVPSTKAMQSAISTAITSGSSFRPGGYDASSNLFPSTGGSGTGGAIRAGDYWIITVAGTLGGTAVLPNDSLQALTNAPGQTASNWVVNGAVTKTYVDDQLATKAPINNPTFNGHVNVPTPTLASDASTKGYVDTEIATREPTITVLPATKGGTGLNFYSIGDLITANSPSTLTTIPAPGVGQLLASAGINTKPVWSNNPQIGQMTFTNTAQPIMLQGAGGFIATITTSGLTGPVTFTIPDGNSNSVVPSTAPANEFCVGITSAGVILYSPIAVSQVSGAAPLNNPTFTGNVSVPTPFASTDAARKDYVDSGLAGKINSTTGTAIQKADGSGGLTAASSATDYQPIISSPTLDNVVSMTSGGVVKDSGVQFTTSGSSNDNSHAPTTAAMQSAISSAITSGSSFRPGGYDASSNLFPSTGGSGTGGAIRAGDYWIITVAGTLGGTAVLPNDSLQALTNAPGQTASNWVVNGAVTKTYVDNQLATKAPINNPTFSGNVNVPTPTLASDATTKGYVDTGLGTKADAAATTAALALKAPLSNPTFTGNVSVPVPSALTDAARKDYVDALIASLVANGFSFRSINYNASTNLFPSSGGSGSAGAVQKGDIYIVGTGGTMPGGQVVVAGDWLTALVNAPGQTASNWNVKGTLNSLQIAGTTLTSTVNNISSTAKVAPSPESITSAITFTNLDEIIILVAPLVNAIGFYKFYLKDSSGNELDVLFSISANQNTGYNQSSIDIIKVNDSQGVINKSNISSYLLFRGYVRTDTPNSYFAVTMSMPYSLIYTNPLSMATSQDSFSYLNDNSTITSMITTNISNLVSFAAPNLSFKMNLNVIATSVSSPQGYIYEPSNTNVIFQFSINSLTGVPAALSPASVAMTTPYKMITTNNRNYLYASTSGGTTIFMWRIGAGTGLLSALSTPSITTPSSPTGMSIDPTDRFLYACFDTAGTVQMYTIAKATGILSFGQSVGATAGMRDCLVHPSGKFLYAFSATNTLLYQWSINPLNGQLTAIGGGTVSTGTTPTQMCIHPNGKYLYVACAGGTTIFMYSIDQTTGALTPLSPSTFTMASNPFGVTMHPNGNYIFVCLQGANSVVQCLVNPSTGLIVATGPSVTVNGARHSCFDYTGTYLYVINTSANRLDNFIINASTGAFTANGTTPAGTNSNSINAV